MIYNFAIQFTQNIKHKKIIKLTNYNPSIFWMDTYMFIYDSSIISYYN